MWWKQEMEIEENILTIVLLLYGRVQKYKNKKKSSNYQLFVIFGEINNIPIREFFSTFADAPPLGCPDPLFSKLVICYFFYLILFKFFVIVMPRF